MIGFLGAGRVGAQAALEVASAGVDDVTLVDIVPGLAEGEAMDISQKIAETGVDVDVKGSTDFSALKGASVVVITAGMARKPGMTRMDLLERNAGIVAAVAKEVAKHAPSSIALTVTNPMDVMNYVVLKRTGFPKGRVVGMGGLLDLSRFKSTVSAMLDVSHSSLSSLVIGEHGESMLPLARYTTVGGVPLTKLMDETQVELAMETTRRVAIDVISKKGATVYAPANGVFRMVRAIALDKREVVPASAYLEGEYGVEGVCIGVPLVLGADGVEKILSLDLNEKESAQFKKGAETIRQGISAIQSVF
ncbi:MAG: malate dehydrogenase [Nitrososphaerota archaeon]|nr:malate dehydrogenase [Nitrososphaerota archaeon]MDG6967105.1 malate dehydrogenase [Nitrososphaerota archaeon]MDG6978107.1 malate dehydrogenase [Nitrososphaerota archaeon]MDG7020327.1 malate dehydrogenase [Nitrososphaerota archaeon]